MRLRVAAIDFLNPAPLLYGFEHDATRLRSRYELHYTSPAACAAALHAGTADLGLIPIAALTPDLAIVPGCAIASLREVRSILLLVKNPGNLPPAEAMAQVRTLAADAASRSSVAYVSILFAKLARTQPRTTEQPADAVAMLATADAALLIGDPALLAREQRLTIEQAAGTPLLWLDVATLWHQLTGLPWVAAVWAVRPEALDGTGIRPQQLTADLAASRDAGLANVERLVQEWTPRMALPPETIRTYLTANIYYFLDSPCLEAIARFRSMAADQGLLPALQPLPLLPL